MAAETNLQKLLRNMAPVLHDGVFVFCTVDPMILERLQVSPVGWFHESEGVTLIVSQEEASSHQLDYSFASKMITLNVHSSLHAVGLLAAVTGRLADCGISVNSISAYYHDHLFVPVERAGDAMSVLRGMLEQTNKLSEAPE